MLSKKVDFTINLIPKDPFFKTTLGRFLNWAVHVGRYVVIFTELVVISSFAARFTLDRRLTDLNDSIHHKSTIVESYGELENKFRLAQAKIENFNQVDQTNNLVEIFPKLQQVVPPDVVLESLEIQPGAIQLEATALSNNSLKFFINNLQLSSNFEKIVVDKIESQGEKTRGYRLTLGAQVAKVGAQ